MHNSASKPIGIFDSGLGGLSIWREMVRLLPNEEIIYLGDSANCPYGSKPMDVILDLSETNTRFLLQQECKLIVLACNTATAAAVDYLRESFDIPFIGMEPALKPAALNTQTGTIGILATEGTFKGKKFQDSRERYGKHVHVCLEVGYGLVELVESGRMNTPEAVDLLRTYIEPMLEQGIDHLVLGCTHYPFLIPSIRKITGDRVKLVDPAPAVARQTQAVLFEKGLLNKDRSDKPYRFFTNGSEEQMQNMLDSLPETAGKPLVIKSLSPFQD